MSYYFPLSISRVVSLILKSLLIVALGSLAGCKKESAQAQEDDSQATPVPVRVAAVKVATMKPSIDLVGVLDVVPERVVALTSQVAGQVLSVSVVEGQGVNKVDEILKLDDRNAQVQQAKARAFVQEAQAVLARLKQGARPEEIEAARQDARKAQASAQSMRIKIDAMKALLDKREVAEVQFERAKSELQTAEADNAAFDARLKLLEAGTRPEEIEEAQAKLAVAEADLAAAELSVQLHRLTSPIGGVVTELSARQGMFVEPLTNLGTIADLSTLFAHVQIPSAYLATVRDGVPVEVHVTALPNRVFKGTVSRLGKQADQRTGNVEAFAIVANETGDLRPGLACKVRVWLPTIPNAMIVPIAAIADRDGSPIVTVVRDNKAYEVEVVLGVQTGLQAQILKGLSPGDLVAVQGGYGLPEGSPCSVVVDTGDVTNSACSTTRVSQD